MGLGRDEYLPRNGTKKRGFQDLRPAGRDERTSGLTHTVCFQLAAVPGTASGQTFLKQLEMERMKGLLRIIWTYLEKAGGSWGEGWATEAARREELLSQRKKGHRVNWIF